MSSWSWWRTDGHSYSWYECLIRTFNFDVMGPVKEVYARIWIKTVWPVTLYRLKRRMRIRMRKAHGRP